MTSHRITWFFLTIALAGTAPLAAQSVQRFAIQGTGVYLIRRAAPSKDVTENRRKTGGEVQLRYTIPLSRLSIGVGYQESSVQSVFIEPRVVVAASEQLALYLSGRAGLAKLVCDGNTPCAAQRMEQFLGVGGGVLIQATSRVALDLGVLYQSIYYSSGRGGQSPVPHRLVSAPGWPQHRTLSRSLAARAASEPKSLQPCARRSPPGRKRAAESAAPPCVTY